ncbi:unnamed protein product [Merluccius merluccius]
MPSAQIEVKRGQTVKLQAWYDPTPNTDITSNSVSWTFLTANNTELIISYNAGSISVGTSQFEGRLAFVQKMPSAIVSLHINNTQEADSGRFLCQVLMPGKGLNGELKLNVIVPPAVPKCSMAGKPVLKGNVTLSCRSGEGKPLPVYKWVKTNPNPGTFFPPMLNKDKGTLMLSNLSSQMSGKYECTASNTAGSESCFINLEIISSTNGGMIAGATVGALVGFIILLIFIYFLLKRSRDNEDEMANDIKEDAQAPKRVSWAKSGGMGSDIISKNGTLSSVSSSPHHKEPFHANHLHHQHPPQQPPIHSQHPHHQHPQYPQRPPSDTASIITATGSMASYRPPQVRHHGGASTPTGYGAYNGNGTSLTRNQYPDGAPQEPIRGHGEHPDSATLPMGHTERPTRLPQAQPLAQGYGPAQPALLPIPRPPALPTSSVISASNIARMGGVPIMVPAQNQAGSLV